jgi:hypothetical protein
LLFCYQNLSAMDNDTTQVISVDADIIALDESISLEFPNTKVDQYSIIITLTNTQDTTINIRVMTCSWSESFSFDSDSLHLYYPGCNSNFPTTIEILAHETTKFYGKLRYYKKRLNDADPLTFKIGFVDLPYYNGGYFDYPYSEEDKKKYKTYWSNDICLRGRLYQ